MPTLFKISGLLLTGAGAFVVQNNPGELRNNICAWDFVAPCADWFDSATVNQVVFLCLMAVSALFFLSLIIPPLAKNYKQTVTKIAQFDPPKKPQAEASAPLPASEPLAVNAPPNRMPMIDFLTKAQDSGWQILDPNSQINEFAAAIKQAGHDGLLVLSGRPVKHHSSNETIRHETLRPIPADHWDEYRFDWDSAIRKHPLTGAIEGINTDNFPTLSSKWNHEKGYVDLHIERQGALAWLEGANSELIALPEAVSIAFDRIRDAAGNKDTISFQLMNRLDGNDQRKIPYNVCQTLFNGTKIPLFGIYPPSRQVKEIPREHAESFMFSDDASEMFNQWNRSERYHSVAVRRSDLEQRLREIT